MEGDRRGVNGLSTFAATNDGRRAGIHGDTEEAVARRRFAEAREHNSFVTSSCCRDPGVRRRGPVVRVRRDRNLSLTATGAAPPSVRRTKWTCRGKLARVFQAECKDRQSD